MSQMGVGSAQSPLTVHSTHWCVATLHAGVLPPHSAFVLQLPGGSWHSFVVIVHLPPVPQSISEKHSTQAPMPEQ